MDTIMRRDDSHSAREALSIGEFTLIPSRRRLQRGNETIKLGSRAVDILQVLSESPGKVVSQRELIQRVWPNVFVEDVSLRFQVRALRKVLGCDGTRYLANVPGRGYSLIAQVSRKMMDEAEVEPAYPLCPMPGRVVGREEDIRKTCEEILSRRFVSLVGFGGIGKTTVAASVAHALLEEFLGAVCFIDLSGVSSPEVLRATIASALGLPVRAQDPIPDLIAHLRNKRLLLIVDSCEHLIESAAEVATQLFAEVPGVHILATSREPLRVAGEYVHSLPALASPPDDASLTAAKVFEYPAALLFYDRVTSAGFRELLSDIDAHTVGSMCRQLGGIALAIELAAGRVATLGVHDTATLLGSQFALLWPGRRTAPARQQTLQATLDWSYNLLSDVECTVLRRLSVFTGPFSLKAAQCVADSGLGAERVASAIGGLSEKFLISADLSTPASRYRLLDTTRAYARDKLNGSDEHEAVHRKHALYYRDFLRATATNETAPDTPTASAMDLDNVRAALRWAFDNGGDKLLGADIASYSAPLWLSRALLSECRDWMSKAAQACKADKGTPAQQLLHMQFSYAASELFTNGFTKETISAWNDALERAEELGDLPTQIIAYTALWAGEIRVPNYASALDIAERCASCVRASSDAGSLAAGEWLLGHTKHHIARFKEAREHIERYLVLDTDAARFASIKVSGYDRRVDALIVLATTLWVLGDAEKAKTIGEQAVTEANALGFSIPILIATTQVLLITYFSEPDLDVVEHVSVEVLEQARTQGLQSNEGVALCFMGLCQGKRGQFGAGMRLVAEGLRLLSATQNEVHTALVLAHVCEIAVAADRSADALFWLTELDANDRNKDDWCSAEILRIRGILAQAQGSRDAAARYFTDAIALAQRQGALSWELRATVSLAKFWAADGRLGDAIGALQRIYARFREGFGSFDLVEARELISALCDEQIRIDSTVDREFKFK